MQPIDILSGAVNMAAKDFDPQKGAKPGGKNGQGNRPPSREEDQRRLEELKVHLEPLQRAFQAGRISRASRQRMKALQAEQAALQTRLQVGEGAIPQRGEIYLSPGRSGGLAVTSPGLRSNPTFAKPMDWNASLPGDNRSDRRRRQDAEDQRIAKLRKTPGTLEHAMAEIDAVRALAPGDREGIKSFLGRTYGKGKVGNATLQLLKQLAGQPKWTEELRRFIHKDERPRWISTATPEQLRSRMSDITSALSAVKEENVQNLLLTGRLGISPPQEARLARLLDEAVWLQEGLDKASKKTASPRTPPVDNRNLLQRAIDLPRENAQIALTMGKFLADGTLKDFDRERRNFNSIFTPIAKEVQKKYPTGLLPKELYHRLESGTFSGNRFQDRFALAMLQNLDPTQIPMSAAALTSDDWPDRLKEMVTLGLSDPEMRKKLAQVDPDAWATFTASIASMVLSAVTTKTLKPGLGTLSAGKVFGPKNWPFRSGAPGLPNSLHGPSLPFEHPSAGLSNAINEVRSGSYEPKVYDITGSDGINGGHEQILKANHGNSVFAGPGKKSILDLLKSPKKANHAFYQQHIQDFVIHYTETLTEENLKHLTIGFVDKLDPGTKGLYFNEPAIALIRRQKGRKGALEAARTFAHEIGHHLMKFMSDEDIRLLTQQFEYEKNQAKNSNIRMYQDLSEWWAYKIQLDFDSRLDIYRYDKLGRVRKMIERSRMVRRQSERDAFLHIIPKTAPDMAIKLRETILKNERTYQGAGKGGGAQLTKDFEAQEALLKKKANSH